MRVLHGLNEGFIPLYHPAQFPACTAIVALSTGALHWLAHCPAALLCVAITGAQSFTWTAQERSRDVLTWKKQKRKKKQNPTESSVKMPGCAINPGPLIKKYPAHVSTFKNLPVMLVNNAVYLSCVTQRRSILPLRLFFFLLRGGFFFSFFFFLKYNNARADVWSVALGNTRLVKIDIAFNISFLWQITSTEESLDKSGNIWMWRGSLSFDCVTPWPLPAFEREAATWYGGGLSGSGYGALLTQDL